MTLKMFSEDTGFIVTTDKDLFAVQIRNETDSINCILDDEDVRELQILCEYHLQNKKSEKEE